MSELATDAGFRHVFLSDPEIGGRYSALSPFGIVPAALAGVDVQAVLEGAQVAAENCELPEGNSGLWLGAALGELALRGRDKLTFVVDPPLGSFGLWAEQLVAESTGKQGRGILPIADEPLADAPAYGSDRVFLHLRDADAPDPRHAEAVKALAAAGHPTITLTASRRERPRPGVLLRRVRHRGGRLGARDQPVRPAQRPGGEGQHGARCSRRARRRTSRTARCPRCSTAWRRRRTSRSWATCPTTTRSTQAVAGLRRALIERSGVATTWGYGPRYLHSTGQFHKGGPPTGRFLELVHDATDDLPVPGQPYSFRTLIDAQAAGDLQTLRAHDLPAVRVRLPAGDLAGAITRLQEEL